MQQTKKETSRTDKEYLSDKDRKYQSSVDKLNRDSYISYSSTRKRHSIVRYYKLRIETNICII